MVKHPVRLILIAGTLAVSVFLLVFGLPLQHTTSSALNSSTDYPTTLIAASHSSLSSSSSSKDSSALAAAAAKEGLLADESIARSPRPTTFIAAPTNIENRWANDDKDDEPFIPSSDPSGAESSPSISSLLNSPDAPAHLLNMHRRWQESFDDNNLFTRLTVVPSLVIPTFHDGPYLQDLLRQFNAPVRHVTIVCNADDTEVQSILKDLKPLQELGALTIFKRYHNAGFSTAVNLGIRRGRRSLEENRKHEKNEKKKKKNSEKAGWNLKLLPIWHFIVNCDSIFKPGSGEKFARETNVEVRKAQEDLELEQQKEQKKKQPIGLFYTTLIHHFCFGVSDAAIASAGYFDSAYFVYMEDVDFRWRVHLAGFAEKITGADIGHINSVNIKKEQDAELGEGGGGGGGGGKKKRSSFLAMIDRTDRGWEYGRMKWGNLIPGRLRSQIPNSGWVTPFNIPRAPLGLWVLDPVHRHCIETGEGPKFSNTDHCWYNGTGLLQFLPKGTVLPEYLVKPMMGMQDYWKLVEREKARQFSSR